MNEIGSGADPRYPAPKRVVVVDDSRTARAWLCSIIRTDPRLEIVGEAADAIEARSVIKQTNPDVITLDIEMPGMSGLEFLRRLIALRPMPVVMVSSLTARGSDYAIQALSLGAVDCLVKPTTVMDRTAERTLTGRLVAAASSHISAIQTAAQPKTGQAPMVRRKGKKIVLIGSSTGGVAALGTVLSGLDPNGPPVVIVQHMAGSFLKSFSKRLDTQLPQDVGLLEPGVPISYGQIRLAPGAGKHSAIVPHAAGWKALFTEPSEKDLHCPSVDALFRSAVPNGAFVTGVILTGLGSDGADGLKALRDAGAHTIGQDRESSVIYGMPQAAYDLGAVAEQLPLARIAAAINTATAPKIRALDGRT